MLKYDERLLSGYIGLGLSLGLWLLSSWRLIFHSVGKRRRVEFPHSLDNNGQVTTGAQRQQQSFAQWFTRRRTFHGLLWMAMSCESLAYADISGILSISKDRIFADKLGYVLLDVAGRSILELLAFCTVTAIWLKTAIESSPSVLWGSQRTSFGLLPPLFLGMIFVLVLASVTLSVVALVLYQAEALETIQELPWSRAQTMLEAVAWGVHALVVMECLIVTSKRVMNLVPTSQWGAERLLLLGKAVLPMLVASLVYATRCLWLLAIFLRCESFARGTWAWWIGFAWLPNWLAVGVLLYSARKRDPSPPSEGELQQPLLLPARPPAEAFLAFSRHRQGLGVEDSFSFCRSPIMQIAPHPGDFDHDNEGADNEEGLSTGSGTASNS